MTWPSRPARQEGLLGEPAVDYVNREAASDKHSPRAADGTDEKLEQDRVIGQATPPTQPPRLDGGSRLTATTGRTRRRSGQQIFRTSSSTSPAGEGHTYQGRS